MLQVDIIIAPGGWMDDARVVQRIVAWNVSGLADVSDYEYVVSWPVPMGTIGVPPSGRWLASNRYDSQVERTGSIKGHRRDQSPAALVAKILNADA